MPIEEMARDELLEIVRRLPTTADGAPIVPGMIVFDARVPYRVFMSCRMISEALIGVPMQVTEWRKLDRYYSTRAAALASSAGAGAKEKK